MSAESAVPVQPTRRRKRSYKERLMELQQQHQLLLSQLAQEQQAHSKLVLENSVVAALCESLAHVHVASTAGQLQQQDSENHKQQQRLVDLLAAEGVLLQQLGSVPPRCGSKQQELLQAASVDGDQHPTIAPANDPMALYTEFLARGRLPNLDSLTSMDLTQTYKVVVQDVAVQLHFLDAGMLPGAAAIAQTKQSCDKFARMLLWCMLAGKSQMVYEHEARNAETMQPLDAAALAGRFSQIAAALPKLNLTQHQQEAIANHWQIWTRILAPIDSELAALSQLGANNSGGNSSSHNQDGTMPAAAAPDAAAAATSSSGGGSSNGGGGNVSISHWSAGIEAEMQQLDRLQVVLQKQRMLTVGCCCWLLGRFSWPQFARLLVLTWPHPAHLTGACRLIHESWARQQQHQQAQGHAAKQTHQRRPRSQQQKQAQQET